MRVAVTDAKTKKAAEKEFPWAEKIIRVEGGRWMCFETVEMYKIWKKQK